MGPAGRKSHPGSGLALAMAALGRRWSVPLQAALRSLPERRTLHDANPSRDVLLFEHERGRFFTVLGLFCAGQGVFWASLAAAALARPQVSAPPPDTEFPDRGRLDVRSALWRYGLAVGCGVIGKAWADFPTTGTWGVWARTLPAPSPGLSKESKGLLTLQNEECYSH